MLASHVNGTRLIDLVSVVSSAARSIERAFVKHALARSQWKILFFIMFLSLFVQNGSVFGQGICNSLHGAAVVAHDGTFLGRISDEFASDSILNEFGQYGSKFNNNSIWNEFGRFGGQFSNMSPFNEHTNTPPLIIRNGQAIGRLSVNRSLSGVIHPFTLRTCRF